MSQISASGITTGKWYHMVMTAIGHTVRCTLSGGTLSSPVTTSYTDAVAPISSGSAGLGGYGVEGLFKNFKVVALP